MDDVKDYLKKLIKQDDVVVIGCSGGPDSICLFDILKNLQKEIDFSLICAHVNHNVRKESKNEQIFIEKYFNIIHPYFVLLFYIIKITIYCFIRFFIRCICAILFCSFY